MKSDDVTRTVQKLTESFKELRLKQGISHDTLATKSGLTRQSISRIESGERIPSIASCLKIAKGLGISLQKILDMIEKTSSANK